MVQGYIKKQVSQITGLTPRLIHFYVDSGVIDPGVYRGRSRGDHHKFSKMDLFYFALIKELRDYGMNIATIKKIVQAVRKKLKRYSKLNETLEVHPYLIVSKESKDATDIRLEFTDLRVSKRLNEVTQELKDQSVQTEKLLISVRDSEKAIADPERYSESPLKEVKEEIGIVITTSAKKLKAMKSDLAKAQKRDRALLEEMGQIVKAYERKSSLNKLLEIYPSAVVVNLIRVYDKVKEA